MSGIYKGPNGEQLHGDGRPVEVVRGAAAGEPAEPRSETQKRLAHIKASLKPYLRPDQMIYIAERLDELVRVDLPRDDGPPSDIESLASQVHDAYLATCARLGWSVRPENAVPYSQLPEDAKELDRATVRTVLLALRARAPEGQRTPTGEAIE